MKCLHESILEVERLLAEGQPLDQDGLTSLFRTVHEIARHGNEGVLGLAKALFTDRP